MSRVGVVIFPNGEKIPFGNLVCVDEEEYLKTGHKGHQESFENDVLTNEKFENYEYDKKNDFWGKSAPSLSKQGLIVLLNRKDYKDEEDKVMGFVPEKPTPMQLVALENYLSANMFTTPDNLLFELINDNFGEYYDENDFIQYTGLRDYCDSKRDNKVVNGDKKMDELGIIIYQDGEKQSFGKYVPADDPEYENTPTHEEAFKDEVLSSFKFKMSDLDYDLDKSLYRNLVDFTKQGIITVLNKDGGILVYGVSNPTIEQVNSILVNERINSIPEQEVYEFIDEYDFVDYKNLVEYATIKKEEVCEHKHHTA